MNGTRSSGAKRAAASSQNGMNESVGRKEEKGDCVVALFSVSYSIFSNLRTVLP